MTDYTKVQENALTGDEPACRGKDFEHHERTDVYERDDGTKAFGWWRCPACGDRGSLEAINTRLDALIPALYRLRKQMLARDAVFLLPSDAAPGPFGEFYGRPLFRVQGPDRPLIALGPDGFGLSGKPLVVQAAQGPVDAGPQALNVTVALDGALLPYLDWPLWLREGGLTCYKDDCQCEHDGDIHQPEPPHWLLSERVTLRTVLESLKQHAEGKP